MWTRGRQDITVAWFIWAVMVDRVEPKGPV